jgi:hypothetical protein
MLYCALRSQLKTLNPGSLKVSGNCFMQEVWLTRRDIDIGFVFGVGLPWTARVDPPPSVSENCFMFEVCRPTGARRHQHSVGGIEEVMGVGVG